MEAFAFTDVLFERKQDLVFLDVSSDSFKDIYNLVKSIPKTVTAFRKYFGVHQGRLTRLDVHKWLPRPEHENLYLSFEDRAFHGHPGGILGFTYAPDNKNRVIVSVLLDAPKNTQKNPKTYNAWFMENVLGVLLHWREFYVHELTHVLDQKRLGTDIETLYAKVGDVRQATEDEELAVARLEKRLASYRGKDKDGLRQKLEAIRTDAIKHREEYNKSYFNSPIETNAYFQQLMSIFDKRARVAAKEGNIGEVSDEIGYTPQEFADKFLDLWKTKYPNAPLTDKTIKGFMKRVATIYHALRWKYITTAHVLRMEEAVLV